MEIKSESPVERLVAKARSRFIAISLVICGITTLGLAIAHIGNAGVPVIRQVVRIILGASCILLSILIKLGYSSIIREIVVILLYAQYWIMILIQHDMISGPAQLAIVNFVFVPLAYFYELKWQNLACFTTAIANIAFLCLYKLFFGIKENLVMTPEQVDAALTATILVLSASMTAIICFNRISLKVYDDVKQMNEVLENNTKEKEVFFATMSHEIRNPLQSLLGSVELLQEDYLKPQAAKPLLEICKGCGETVLNLISNILDMSKIAAEKMTISPTPSDLREIVNRVIRISQARVKGKRLTLDIIDNPELPTGLELDKQRVEQIILNIVSNAIKFTSKGCVIVKLDWIPLEDMNKGTREKIQEVISESSWSEVMELNESNNNDPIVSLAKYKNFAMPSLPIPAKTARNYTRTNFNGLITPRLISKFGSSYLQPYVFGERQGIAKIEVMDTGIGINKENSKKLFQAYQQANSTISGRYGGTGLGLWITKNILKQMNGDIGIKSKEGKGSNFIIAFPVKVCNEVPTFEDVAVNPQRYEQIRGKTALILDDIPENTYVTMELLNRYGITSICEVTGAEALEEYKNNENIDIIITDLRMPMMSGQTFILQIRKYETIARRKRTPIIIVTAENSIDEKRQCLTKHGADEYLIKPVKFQELISSFTKLLGNAKSGSNLRIGAKIMIIDDDVISSGFMEKVLNSSGCITVVKNSLKQAKEYFEMNYHMLKIIFLDNFLGDGFGIDFLKFAKNLGKDKMPFIVSMSGNDISEQREMYREYKVNMFLQKPIKKQDLLDVVKIS